MVLGVGGLDGGVRCVIVIDAIEEAVRRTKFMRLPISGEGVFEIVVRLYAGLCGGVVKGVERGEEAGGSLGFGGGNCGLGGHVCFGYAIEL